MKLDNPKHEKFVQVWHETGNKSEAYRKSHPSCAKWKDETVHNKAYVLSKRGEILARYDQIAQDQLNAHGITIKSLLEELDEARKLALTTDTPQTSSAISATMNKAKLVGLDSDSLSVTFKTKTLDDFYADA